MSTTTSTTTNTTPTTNTSTTRPLRVIVLQSSPDGCAYEASDPPARVDVHVTRAPGWSNRLEVDTLFVQPGSVPTQLVALAKQVQQEQQQYDCVVNLCDGAWDEPSAGIQVVQLLQHQLRLPFTGANVDFYEPTREQMKRAALACNTTTSSTTSSSSNKTSTTTSDWVRVPQWKFIHHETELEEWLHDDFPTTQHQATETNASAFNHNNNKKQQPQPQPPPWQFPLLVKHFSSYSSIGLTKDSKVWNVTDLKTQCQRMLHEFGGCLIEEFIVGREFTVLVAEVPDDDDDTGTCLKAYEPVECSFGPNEDFKHFQLKWVDYDSMCWTKVSDADLAQRLKDMSCAIFQAMRGRGYGRLDIRSDPTGQHLYFLEINPNCGVFYPPGEYGSADFILHNHDPVEAHAQFLWDQVQVALRHWRREQDARYRTVQARYHAMTQSWGVYALRDIRAGEILQTNEEQAHYLVSKAHVLRQWNGVPECVVARNRGNGANHHDNDPTTTSKTTGDSLSLSSSQSNSYDYMRTWSNFAAYCWPVSDELFVLWDPDPEKWLPINHSCDPNAWYQPHCGLNLVARRDIAKHEEICMDYATMVGYFPEMKAFACECGSPLCRRIITGMDMVTHPDLTVRYEGHTTSYIASKVKELKLFAATTTATATSAEMGALVGTAAVVGGTSATAATTYSHHLKPGSSDYADEMKASHYMDGHHVPVSEDGGSGNEQGDDDGKIPMTNAVHSNGTEQMLQN